MATAGQASRQVKASLASAVDRAKQVSDTIATADRNIGEAMLAPKTGL